MSRFAVGDNAATMNKIKDFQEKLDKVCIFFFTPSPLTANSSVFVSYGLEAEVAIFEVDA